MALGLHGGYPFEKPEWMNNRAFNDFITESEFDTSEYQNIRKLSINFLKKPKKKTKHNKGSYEKH
ncbi:hypothetical protein [Gaetbulibacter saemankumensis]|uniref:hypothetical protein n=1 Tax=Gaetbulibacter saemankumensis TaxID=311208 RepID=UPI000422F501|nr:hypothetical protein [Gaetbulibacter saemankumensis]